VRLSYYHPHALTAVIENINGPDGRSRATLVVNALYPGRIYLSGRSLDLPLITADSKRDVDSCGKIGGGPVFGYGLIMRSDVATDAQASVESTRPAARRGGPLSISCGCYCSVCARFKVSERGRPLISDVLLTNETALRPVSTGFLRHPLSSI